MCDFVFFYFLAIVQLRRYWQAEKFRTLQKMLKKIADPPKTSKKQCNCYVFWYLYFFPHQKKQEKTPTMHLPATRKILQCFVFFSLTDWNPCQNVLKICFFLSDGATASMNILGLDASWVSKLEKSKISKTAPKKVRSTRKEMRRRRKRMGRRPRKGKRKRTGGKRGRRQKRTPKEGTGKLREGRAQLYTG